MIPARAFVAGCRWQTQIASDTHSHHPSINAYVTFLLACAHSNIIILARSGIRVSRVFRAARRRLHHSNAGVCVCVFAHSKRQPRGRVTSKCKCASISRHSRTSSTACNHPASQPTTGNGIAHVLVLCTIRGWEMDVGGDDVGGHGWVVIICFALTQFITSCSRIVTARCSTEPGEVGKGL